MHNQLGHVPKHWQSTVAAAAGPSSDSLASKRHDVNWPLSRKICDRSFPGPLTCSKKSKTTSLPTSPLQPSTGDSCTLPIRWNRYIERSAAGRSNPDLTSQLSKLSTRFRSWDVAFDERNYPGDLMDSFLQVGHDWKVTNPERHELSPLEW